MWIFSIAVFALWAFYAIWNPSSCLTNDHMFRHTFEKSVFPLHNAVMFGFTIGISGLGCHTFMSGSVYDPKTAYTLTNIPEWSGWAKFFLGVAIFTVLFLAVINLLIRKSPAIFLRMVLSAAATFLLGYWLARIFPFLYTNWLLELLTIAFGLVEGLFLAMYPISAILFLLPTSTIAAMNRASEERERKQRSIRAAAQEAADAQEQKDIDAPHSIHTMPSVITGPYGHTYRQISVGAFSAEYLCDHDRSTVTIHDSDLNAAGNGAMVDGGYYHW